MKSRFPVAFGIVVLVLAACWYDATFTAPAQAGPAGPAAGMALAR